MIDALAALMLLAAPSENRSSRAQLQAAPVIADAKREPERRNKQSMPVPPMPRSAPEKTIVRVAKPILFVSKDSPSARAVVLIFQVERRLKAGEKQ